MGFTLELSPLSPPPPRPAPQLLLHHRQGRRDKGTRLFLPGGGLHPGLVGQEKDPSSLGHPHSFSRGSRCRDPLSCGRAGASSCFSTPGGHCYSALRPYASRVLLFLLPSVGGPLSFSIRQLERTQNDLKLALSLFSSEATCGPQETVTQPSPQQLWQCRLIPAQPLLAPAHAGFLARESAPVV